MTTPTFKQREERYKTLSPEAQELYAGEHIGESLRAIFNKYQLDRAQYKEYANVFGDTVLGFVTQTEMARALIERLGLSDIIAHQIFTELELLLPKSPSTKLSAVAATPPTPQAATKPLETATPEPSPTTSTVPVAQEEKRITSPVAATPAPTPVEDRPFYARTPNYSDVPKNTSGNGAPDPYREPPE